MCPDDALLFFSRSRWRWVGDEQTVTFGLTFPLLFAQWSFFGPQTMAVGKESERRSLVARDAVANLGTKDEALETSAALRSLFPRSAAAAAILWAFEGLVACHPCATASHPHLSRSLRLPSLVLSSGGINTAGRRNGSGEEVLLPAPTALRGSDRAHSAPPPEVDP